MTKIIKAVGNHWGEHTFKREMALVGFVAWLTLTFYYFSMRDPALVTAFSSGYSVATTMIFLYIGSAFGMDFYAKQLKPVGAP
jgi:uncharacterized membrane protein YGL010W